MRLWQGFLVSFCIGLCGIAVAGQENPAVSKPEITYNKDVAPLLQKHCVACHRPSRKLGQTELARKALARSQGLRRSSLAHDQALIMGSPQPEPEPQ
jgi:hypothetical protein